MFIDTSLRPQGEQQQVGKLKLSEAIRIGAKIRSQTHDALFNLGKSCALGAIYEAIFGFPKWGHLPYPMQDTSSSNAAMDKLYDAFPVLRKLREEIVLRNDADRLSREDIADWLETQGL